jgi:hypothetical protein
MDCLGLPGEKPIMPGPPEVCPLAPDPEAEVEVESVLPAARADPASVLVEAPPKTMSVPGKALAGVLGLMAPASGFDAP